jgi:hypothetical protein
MQIIIKMAAISKSEACWPTTVATTHISVWTKELIKHQIQLIFLKMKGNS